MKHLKLFESFGEPEKSNAVNAIFIEFFLLDFFIKNDVRVQYQTLHAKKTIQNELIKFFIVKYPLYSAITEDLFTYSRKYDNFWLYDSNLIFDKVFKKIKCKKREIDYMRVYSIKPMFKYIKYLQNTPNKKHLLIK